VCRSPCRDSFGSFESLTSRSNTSENACGWIGEPSSRVTRPGSRTPFYSMAVHNFHRILARCENSEDAAIAECDLLADARVGRLKPHSIDSVFVIRKLKRGTDGP
jgi:hypothetical protein